MCGGKTRAYRSDRDARRERTHQKYEAHGHQRVLGEVVAKRSHVFFLPFFFLRRDSHGRAHGRVTEERKRSRATRDSCDPIRAPDAKSASGRSLVGEEFRRSEMSEGTRVLFSQIQRTRSASFESDFFPSISSRRRNGVRCSQCPDSTFSRIKCHGARYTRSFSPAFSRNDHNTPEQTPDCH